MDKSKLIGVIVLMLSLAVHFFCFSGLISAHPERLLEVDSLNLSDITRSILSGVPVASWQFPPSPYLFPEILFHFPIAAMVPNVAMAQVIHAYCLSLGFLAAQVALLRYIVGPKVVSWVGVSLLTLSNALLGTMIDHSVISPMYHFGTFVALLFAIVALDRALLSSSHGVRWIVVLTALCVLLIFSDWLFVAWFVFPALGYIVLGYIFFGVSLQRAVGMFILMGALIGVVRTVPYLLPNAFSPQGMSGTGFSEMLQVLSTPLESLRRFVELGVEVGTQQTQVPIALGVGLIAMWWLRESSVTHVGAWFGYGGRPIRLALLTLLILGVNIFVVANHDQAPARYLIPVYYLPVALFLIGMTGLFLKRCSQALCYVFALMLLVVGGLKAQAVWTAHVTMKEWVSSRFDIACFDAAVSQHTLRNGIADHLQVRQLNLLASGEARVYQVYGGDLTPFWFQSSRHAYPESFDFAVINQRAKQAGGLTRVYYYLNESSLKERVGPPDVRVQCQGFDLLVYHLPKSISIDREFCDHVNLPCG